jgi:hypothetical protein
MENAPICASLHSPYLMSMSKEYEQTVGILGVGAVQLQRWRDVDVERVIQEKSVPATRETRAAVQTNYSKQQSDHSTSLRGEYGLWSISMPDWSETEAATSPEMQS